MNVTDTIPYYAEIKQALNQCLTETNLRCGKKTRGKVRDIYDIGDQLILVTTDRQSAFDRQIASVPFKGQVLNLTSAWWFEQTANIVPNHVVALAHPNILIAKKCKIFPIEFVVRAYITGSTSTSLWTQYQKGVRDYCGHAFPEGLKQNQRLANIVLTPTTKEQDHDRPITPEEIIREGWMTAEDWEEASLAALSLFAASSKIAEQQGFILVDTKYEFGRDQSGKLCVADEINTPDSSRYWLKDSYEERFSQGLAPENIDKEFLRLWYVDQCNPYQDAILPKAPDDLIIKLASRYIMLYERITGRKFEFNPTATPEGMMALLAPYMSS